MYGDYSRLTDDPTRHYTGVWAQQGRVELDSDANELAAILIRQLRTLTVDLFGVFGATTAGAGFEVDVSGGREADPVLSPGYYYVNGLRCELPPQRYGDPEPSYRQYAGPVVGPIGDKPYIMELVVWEQIVSAFHDPHLIEPALGPAGTSTSLRTQLCWRLATTTVAPKTGHALTGAEDRTELIEAYLQLNDEHAHRPSLRARARAASDDADSDAPLVPRNVGYRGPENQLYRVEINTGGRADVATAKWSRDNGSNVFELASLQPMNRRGESIATLATVPTDSGAALEIGDWVELRDDSWVPSAPPAVLLQVRGYNAAAGEVSLAVPEEHTIVHQNPGLHPFLRRWDQHPDRTADDNAMAITQPGTAARPDGWIELEDGIRIKFPDPDAEYRQGDYWLIPARTATGGVLWPTDSDGRAADVTAYRPPLYRAPLALVAQGARPVDLRSLGRTTSVRESDDDPGLTTRITIPTVSATTVPPVPARPRPVLTTESASMADTNIVLGTTYQLDQGNTSVGRATGNKVQLNDPSVSREQAVITVDGGKVTVTDIGAYDPVNHKDGSANGTFVRGEQISAATSVSDGDTVSFGMVVLRLSFDPSGG